MNNEERKEEVDKDLGSADKEVEFDDPLKESVTYMPGIQQAYPAYHFFSVEADTTGHWNNS